MKKINVLVLCGGRSTEHEVSINSARNVLHAINRDKYTPILVGISKDTGTWYHIKNNELPPLLTTILDTTEHPEKVVNLRKVGHNVDVMSDDGSIDIPVDFVLPILHGKYGEDGCLQGLCRMFNLPFAGPAVASSAVCMDKDYTKRILESSGVPIGPYITLYSGETISYEDVTEQLGTPFFLKPANTGSSVGVYKIKSQAEFTKYMSIITNYDEKIVIEKYLPGQEVECAVLGNQTPQASVLGSIIPKHEFYSYDAKYIDPDGAELNIPANLDAATTELVQSYALKAYKALGCKGFSRVDFFVTANNEIYLNEINTIPGFTNISMYPKLFEASGIEYADLITKIIEYGFKEFNDWCSLSTEHYA